MDRPGGEPGVPQQAAEGLLGVDPPLAVQRGRPCSRQGDESKATSGVPLGGGAVAAGCCVLCRLL